MVSAPRAAAGADPPGALARADRTLGAGGQRCRRGHRVHDDARRSHRRRSRLRQCDPARGADAGARRRSRRAVPAAPVGHQAGKGGQAVGRAVGDGPVRVRTSLRRQWILRVRRRGDLRIRGRRAVGGLADVSRLRRDRAVGVSIRHGSGRRARHPDEQGAASADAHRGGLFHRRAVAAGRPNDPPKALADSRFPVDRGNRSS